MRRLLIRNDILRNDHQESDLSGAETERMQVEVLRWEGETEDSWGDELEDQGFDQELLAGQSFEKTDHIIGDIKLEKDNRRAVTKFL